VIPLKSTFTVLTLSKLQIAHLNLKIYRDFAFTTIHIP
jgi:hypothetical protein